MADEEILKIPIDSSELDPALAILNKIDQKLVTLSKQDQFTKMSKSVDKANKELKKTDSLLDKIFQKLKLSKLAEGLKIGGAVAAGGVVGLGTMAVEGMKGGIETGTTAERLGISPAQLEAMKHMGKMKNVENIVPILQNIQQALDDPQKVGALAQVTRMNPAELAKSGPVGAFFSLIKSIQTNPLMKTAAGRNLFDQNMKELGMSAYQLMDIFKKGSKEYENFYQEGLGMYNLNWKRLEKGDQSITKFGETLGIITKKVGASVAPAMETALNAIEPLLEKFGNLLAKMLGSITAEDVEAFIKGIQGFVNFIKGFGSFATAPFKLFGGGKSKNKKVIEHGIDKGFFSNTTKEKQGKHINIGTVNINTPNSHVAKKTEEIINGTIAQHNISN